MFNNQKMLLYSSEGFSKVIIFLKGKSVAGEFVFSD